MKITLNDDHEYFVDGVRKPGVSEILEDVGLIDKTWYNDHACLRGTYVHKAVEIYHTSILDFSSLDDEIKPYFRAYVQFVQKTRFKPLLVERMYHEPTYDYCGTPDLVGYVNGELTVIDIKTGGVSNWAPIQLAGYQKLIGKRVEGKAIPHRMILNLTTDEKWKPVICKDRHDNDIFMAALTIYNFKHGRI